MVRAGLSKEKVTGIGERTYSYVGTVEYMRKQRRSMLVSACQCLSVLGCACQCLSVLVCDCQHPSCCLT